MPASFYELHRVEKKITKALEPLEQEDKEKVLAAVLSLVGLAVAQK